MKIAVITLHNVTNFGSMLQTYATQTYLESMGWDVEIIDFVPDGLRFYRAMFPENDKRNVLGKAVRFIPKLVCNGIQYGVLCRFLKRYIKRTDRRYSCFEELALEPPLADIYMSGSDQIWNNQNSNRDKDIRAYFLDFVPEGKRRIAYGGSFGRSQFPEDMMEQMKGYLERYDAVSVRESAGLNILERMGITEGVHVLDPTLLLRPDQWRSFSRKVREKKYLFVYNLNRNPLIKRYARIIADEKGLKVVNFADTFEFIKGARNRVVNAPEDFVGYIAGADYVITDSFHGTAFSINFNRQFACVAAPRYNSRLTSLLKLTGLEDRLFLSSVDLKTALKPIEYKEVNQILEDNRNGSGAYLSAALSGGNI